MEVREEKEFEAFDEVWQSLTPAERVEANALLRRYVEIVIGIAERQMNTARQIAGKTDNESALTDEKGSRMLTLS